MPSLYKSLLSFGFVALVFSVCCAVIYFMRLSIFDRAMLEWTFVYGLAASGAGFSALFVKGVWDQ